MRCDRPQAAGQVVCMRMLCVCCFCLICRLADVTAVLTYETPLLFIIEENLGHLCTSDALCNRCPDVDRSLEVATSYEKSHEREWREGEPLEDTRGAVAVLASTARLERIVLVKCRMVSDFSAKSTLAR